MSLFKLFFRDKQEVSVDAKVCWEVRWTSRYGEYSRETKPELRVFTSEEDANEFKDALVDAFKLIKHTSGTKVKIKKQDS